MTRKHNYPKTRKSNVLTYDRKRPEPKTHCIRGHEKTAENLLWNTINGRKYPICRICRLESKRSYRQRQGLGGYN